MPTHSVLTKGNWIVIGGMRGAHLLHRIGTGLLDHLLTADVEANALAVGGGLSAGPALACPDAQIFAIKPEG